MDKVLVTGASGQLGANLVRRLLDDGHGVRVLLLDGANNVGMDGLDVERVFGDLRDGDSLRAAVDGCARVYHCASKVSSIDGDRRHKRDIFETNVLGTRNLLAAARRCGVEKVVVTGTLNALGYDLSDPARPVTETGILYPFTRVSPYERSKVLMEHMCLRAAADGLDVVVVVCSGIIGGHDYLPSLIGQTICDFANGRMLGYVAGGSEFVAARDVVEGHVLAMEKGRSGQRYIISTEFITLDDMLAFLEEVTGRSRPRLRVSSSAMSVVMPLAEVASWYLSRFHPNVDQRFSPYAIRRLVAMVRADISKAKEQLGYRPTSLRDAVREAYDFHSARGTIEDAPAKERRVF